MPLSANNDARSSHLCGCTRLGLEETLSSGGVPGELPWGPSGPSLGDPRGLGTPDAVVLGAVQGRQTSSSPRPRKAGQRPSAAAPWSQQQNHQDAKGARTPSPFNHLMAGHTRRPQLGFLASAAAQAAVTTAKFGPASPHYSRDTAALN